MRLARARVACIRELAFWFARRRLLAILALGLMTMAGLVLPAAATRLDGAPALLKVVNQYRARQGLKPLVWDERLQQVAQRQANFMASGHGLVHIGADGANPAQRLRQNGIPFQQVGENIAEGYETPVAVVAAWMQSPDHRRHLLNPVFQRMGAGYEEGYWALSLTD